MSSKQNKANETFALHLHNVPTKIRDEICLDALYSLSPGESYSILRRQEERLNHLRHASKCRDSSCTAIPDCAFMKEHWVHVVTCKNFDKCRAPECVSSRYVLSKYAQYVRKVSSAQIHRHSPKNTFFTLSSSSLNSVPSAHEDEEAANILMNLNSPSNSPAVVRSASSPVNMFSCGNKKRKVENHNVIDNHICC